MPARTKFIRKRIKELLWTKSNDQFDESNYHQQLGDLHSYLSGSSRHWEDDNICNKGSTHYYNEQDGHQS